MIGPEERAEKAEESGDLEAALTYWREATKNEQNAVFFCRYGRVAEQLAIWNEAEAAFSTALRLDPTLLEALECMGDLWATRTDKETIPSLLEAKQWFLKALKVSHTPRVLTFLGSTHRALEEVDEARAAFEEAIKVDPDYEEALYNLAALHEKTNPQRSIELLERAVLIDSDYCIAHQALGRIYQRRNDLLSAEYHFRRALEIDPADYWANIYLANLFGVQGRNKEADQTYKNVTDLHPEVTGGLELYTRFLDSIGEHERAGSVRAQQKQSKNPGNE